MVRKRPLEIIARTMAALLTRPLTIKMRTGVFKAGLEKTQPSGFFFRFFVFLGFFCFFFAFCYIFAQEREFLGFFQFQEYF